MEEKYTKETNCTNLDEKLYDKKQFKIKLSNLLVASVVILLILIILITIIFKQKNEINILNKYANNSLENVIYENSDLKTTPLNNSVSELEEVNNSTSNDELLNSNLRKVNILNERTEPKQYTYKDSNLDYNILYYGIPISENIGVHSIGIDDGFENTKENIDKFNQTYYTYKPDGFMRVINNPNLEVPSFFDPPDNKILQISNLSTLSVSKEYDLMPRTIEYEIEYYDYENDKYYNFWNKIEEHYSDKNLLTDGIRTNQIAKVDLNGDNNYIYIVLSIEKVIIEVNYENNAYEETGISFNFDAFDKDGNHITTLLSYMYDNNYLNIDKDSELPSFKDFSGIMCADLDNDTRMEILIPVPWYEFGEDVYTYKYENGKILGETNAIIYISP